MEDIEEQWFEHGWVLIETLKVEALEISEREGVLGVVEEVPVLPTLNPPGQACDSSRFGRILASVFRRRNSGSIWYIVRILLVKLLTFGYSQVAPRRRLPEGRGRRRRQTRGCLV